MEVENYCPIILNKNTKTSKEEEEVLPLPDGVEKSVNKIIKKEGYKTCDVYKRSISTEGGNYLAVLYEVDIKGKTSGNDKETHLFIKSCLQGNQFKIFSLPEVYAKESFVYTELAQIYNELQDEADVPPEERFKIIKSYDECNSKAIILENVAKKGFKTCHRTEVIPLKLAELSVQQLARFHGLSFVLEKKRPEYYNTTIKNIKTPFDLNEDWKTFVKNNFGTLTKCLDDNLREKVMNFYEIMVVKNSEYLNNFTGISCLCHGDFRANNVLMNETNGDITEAIVVDYQLIFYGCPVLDFIYLIFTATDKEFRKNHLTNLKNLYCDSMKSFLKYFDMDVESVYPRKEFERNYKDKLDYGLMVCMQILPFLFVENDEIPDLSNTPSSDLTFTPNTQMLDRLKGMLEDYIEWGYL